jgi:anti-sigma regulatory factor (Ser/Thr protein kinase)/predicted ArsR family transcriptional regulator
VEVVDWYLDSRDGRSVSRLRQEIAGFLRRHADTDADVASAELAVSELLGNLVRHAPGPAWVSLHWPADTVRIAVTDLGPSFDIKDVAKADDLGVSGRGLMIVDAVASRLTALARAPGAGSRVVVDLPLARQPTVSIDAEPSAGTVLPEMSEARAEGGFGRESFLRALVVQLAQSVELIAGPELAERAVAQVGADVGGQMELEYRVAREVVGRMSPEQVADCLVRLKAAIEGGFTLVSATSEQIVLVNDRCPFGPVVQHAPALCRMTSSVFGGIAARNSPDGHAAVLLEERIAVGDPHCRVVIYLGKEAADVRTHAQAYRAPAKG